MICEKGNDSRERPFAASESAKKKVTVSCPGSFAVTRTAALFAATGKAAQSGTDRTGNMQ